MKKSSKKRSFKSKKHSFKPNLIVFFALTSIGAFVLFAMVQPVFTLANTTLTIYPNGQGFYTAWNGDENDIDETGTPDCEDGSTDGNDNVAESTTGDRESVNLNLSSIPNGATVTSVNVFVTDQGATIAGGSYQTFVRVGSADTDSGVNLTTTSTSACTTKNQVINVIDFTKTSSTDLEVGIVKTGIDTNKVWIGTINAVVTYTPLTITASAGAGGSISPSGTAAVATGDTPTYISTPNIGNVLADVLVDGVSQGRLNSYTFPSIIISHNITASFNSDWSQPADFDNNDSVGNPQDALTSNDDYATFNADGDDVEYDEFGLNSIPPGMIIDGIEVALEGNRSSTRTLLITLSWNNATSFTASQSVAFPSDDDSTVVVGGASNTWGRTWTPSEFSDANFQVRVDEGGENGSVELDQIQVKVHYSIPSGHIVVDKITNPSGDSQSFSFDATGGAYADFALTDTDSPNDQTLASGNYSISETVPGGWTQSNATCISNIGDSETIGAIELDSGETVTCTFINTKKGHLIVQKTTYPADDTTQFPVTASGSGTITGGGASVVTDATDKDYEVTPGTYSVTEDLSSLPLWQNVINEESTDCTNIEVGAGETQTCTIINKKAARITVTKTSVGGEDTFHFSGLGRDNGFDLDTTNQPENRASSFFDVFTELEGSDFSVTETVPGGWDVDNETCNLESVRPGDKPVCDFTNTKRASFRLEKISNPDSNSGSFQFDLMGPEQTGIPALYVFTPSGIWNLSNLLNGPYSFSETIISPSDWTGSQTVACNGNVGNSPSGSVAIPFVFTLSPGESMSCVVNNTQDALISGKKFEDANADGIAGENQGIEDWEIIATKIIADDPETQDIDESLDTLTYPDTTNEDGNYTLRVQPGTYKICEMLQEDYFQSYPTTDTADSTSCDNSSRGYELTVVAGDNINAKDFGNYQKGSISGIKFEDINGNGVRDEGELPLPNWMIKLSNGETKITGEDGSYTFGDLLPGAYTVSENQQDSWVQTMPKNSENYNIPLVSGQNAIEKDFGNFKLVTITGFKWDDKDGDGIWRKEGNEENPVEPGLQDVTVALGRQNGEPRQENGHETIPIEIIAMSLTGADGSFTISGVGPGHHKLFEESKSGWQATNPAARTDSFFDITYRIDLQPQQKPLVADSFFDVFVELSGHNVNQSEATKGLETTIPGVPLEFGNHELLVIITKDSGGPSGGGNSGGGGGGGEGSSAYNSLSADAKKVDANKDGKIDILDLNILMVHWGETGGIGDFNGDGKVDILDFQSLMVNWTI